MLRSGKWWWYVCLVYFGAQCLLYSQVIKTADNGTSSQTPWEHLTLESALVIAVGVQYRENRAKEAAAIQMAKDAAAAHPKGYAHHGGYYDGHGAAEPKGRSLPHAASGMEAARETLTRAIAGLSSLDGLETRLRKLG